MHLEGKRLTAKYRASKMFLLPFFWPKFWTELAPNQPGTL